MELHDAHPDGNIQHSPSKQQRVHPHYTRALIDGHQQLYQLSALERPMDDNPNRGAWAHCQAAVRLSRVGPGD